MKRTDHRSQVSRNRWLVPMAACLASALIAMPALAEKPTGKKKLDREIGIMETTIDHVLVESPNFLVSGQSVTDGIYLDEMGAVFTFSVNLIPYGWNGGGNWSNWIWHDSNVEIDDDGDRIVIHKHGDWDDEDDDNDKKSKAKKDRKKINWREKEKERSEDLYSRGKAELTELLLDYGDSISSLTDSQWIVLAADLEGDRYFDDKKLSKYIIKARVGDLRAFGDGTLSRDAMIAKIVVDEH